MVAAIAAQKAIKFTTIQRIHRRLKNKSANNAILHLVIL